MRPSSARIIGTVGRCMGSWWTQARMRCHHWSGQPCGRHRYRSSCPLCISKVAGVGAGARERYDEVLAVNISWVQTLGLPIAIVLSGQEGWRSVYLTARSVMANARVCEASAGVILICQQCCQHGLIHLACLVVFGVEGNCRRVWETHTASFVRLGYAVLFIKRNKAALLKANRGVCKNLPRAQCRLASRASPHMVLSSQTSPTAPHITAGSGLSQDLIYI